MLTTDDVMARVFGPMRVAYGGQWKHGETAAKVWRNAIARFPVEQIERATSESMNRYVNHPPTLPQFLELLRPRKVANTYLPAPQMDGRMVGANKILLRVLLVVGGVDAHCLRNLVALKNALLEEADMDAARMEAELMALASA